MTARYILMGLLTFFGVFGLFMAAKAHDGAFELVGMIVFLFSVFYIFYLVHQVTEPKSEDG